MPPPAPAGGRGGGRGRGRGRGKAPRLGDNHESANYAQWALGARDMSTADSRDLSLRAVAAAAGGIGAAPAAPAAPLPPHPSLMDRPLKRISHVYIAHFIDWAKAQAAAAAARGGPVAAGPAGRAGGPAAAAMGGEGRLPAAGPPSPTSRIQQLLASRGLAGAAAGLFGGPVGAGPAAHGLPPPSVLERHGPPGAQPPAVSAMLAGGYNQAGRWEGWCAGSGLLLGVCLGSRVQRLPHARAQGWCSRPE